MSAQSPITQPRIVHVRQNILKRNDELAHQLRERFQAAGVFVVSLVSSPGSGKTAFLERHSRCSNNSNTVPRLWWAIWPPTMTQCGWRAARLR